MARVFAGTRALMAAATKAASAQSAGASAGRGILAPLPVSPALCKFLGVQEISRGAALKKIWEHIKANKLQDAADKKLIRCDDKLKAIFDGKDKVGITEIPKLMSPHFVKS